MVILLKAEACVQRMINSRFIVLRCKKCFSYLDIFVLFSAKISQIINQEGFSRQVKIYHLVFRKTCSKLVSFCLKQAK